MKDMQVISPRIIKIDEERGKKPLNYFGEGINYERGRKEFCFKLISVQIAEGTLCLQFLCLDSHHLSLRQWLDRDNTSQYKKPIAVFCILPAILQAASGEAASNSRLCFKSVSLPWNTDS